MITIALSLFSYNKTYLYCSRSSSIHGLTDCMKSPRRCFSTYQNRSFLDMLIYMFKDKIWMPFVTFVLVLYLVSAIPLACSNMNSFSYIWKLNKILEITKLDRHFRNEIIEVVMKPSIVNEHGWMTGLISVD